MNTTTKTVYIIQGVEQCSGLDLFYRGRGHGWSLDRNEAHVYTVKAAAQWACRPGDKWHGSPIVNVRAEAVS